MFPPLPLAWAAYPFLLHFNQRLLRLSRHLRKLEPARELHYAISHVGNTTSCPESNVPQRTKARSICLI